MMPDPTAPVRINTAQARNLRNWPPEELHLKTLPVVIRLDRPVSADTVVDAVRQLVDRHDALRSTLVFQDDEPWQVVRPGPIDPPCTRLDIGQAARVWERVSLRPDERAAELTLYLRQDAVELVRLTVSHVFTDALGLLVLARELRRLIEGRPLPIARPAQPSAFALGPQDEPIRQHTEYWRGLLVEAPRSCTYSGVARDERENVAVVTVPLAESDVRQVTEGARALGITPNALWVTATSVLVGALTRQHRQVARSTFANRFTRAQLGAVAQLAQAVYLPIAGSANQTLRQRAESVSALLWSSYDKGSYDVNGLLNTLNQPPVARGALFQPAFELNYLPRPHRDAARRPLRLGREDVATRIDPPSAKADLAVLVTHIPDPVLQLSSRRPVRGQREGGELVAELLRVVRTLCTEPDRSVEDVGVAPFPAVEALVLGHHSGVAVDPVAVAALIDSLPGVHSAGLEVTGDGLLRAQVDVDHPISATELLANLRQRQPWWSGSVVPDELVLTIGSAQNSARTTEASS